MSTCYDDDESKKCAGNIPWMDPMVTAMYPTILKNTLVNGIKGLLNFGRCRTPTAKYVTDSINRVNEYDNKYIPSVWISWSYIVVPGSVLSYLLWKNSTNSNFTNSFHNYTETFLSNINSPSFPMHEYYTKWMNTDICTQYINIPNICKTLSIGGMVLNSFLILIASAINYNAPTPKQPKCQIFNELYPYYKHVELVQYNDNIWISQMPFLFESMEFGVRMVIIVLNEQNKDVLVYSPIRLTKNTLDKITQYKWNIKYLMAPNCIHHLFLKEWMDKFPNVKVIAPPNLKQRRTDITFDYEFNIDVNDQQWKVENIPDELNNKDIVEFMVIKTGIFHEEIVMFHKLSKTLIVADNIENIGHDPETSDCSHLSWTNEFMFVLAGMDGRPSAPTDLKLAVDRKLYSKSIEKIIEWEFERIVPSHGRLIENNAKDVYIAANAFVL